MIIAVKGIIVKNKKYLLQLRDKKKNIYFPNFWGLFGGTVENNETAREALVREIKEETNLSVKVSSRVLLTKYELFSSKQKYKTIYYLCKIIRKKKIILTEGQQYKFFSMKRIKKISIVPWDIVAISLASLKKSNKNFFPRKK